MKNWFFFGLFLILTGCAIESVPTGGEKDNLSPEIVETYPANFSKNFNAQEIILVFDEYVELKSFSQQFSISPPVKNKIEHSLKGKKLTLTLKDSLAENTTYTLSFGNAIVDITEGNAQTTYKYVFATGDIIDSLKIQGHVHNALLRNPAEGVLAMLYPENAGDSAAYLTLPRYYTTTLEDGFFSIEHIAAGNYKLVLIDDKNFDFKLSGKGEKIGFLNKPIDAEKDSLYDISIFREKNELTFVQVKHVDYGKAQVYYSANIPASAEFNCADSTELWVDFSAERDTFNIWFKENNADSLLIFATYQNQLDTLFIRKTEKEKPAVVLKEVSKIVAPNQFLTIACNAPISKLDPTKLLFTDNTDTLENPPIEILENKLQFKVSHQPQLGHKYKVYAYPGLTETFYNDFNDTQALEFSVKLEREYAFYILELKRQENQQSIVQLLDEKGNLLFEYIITGSKKIEMPYLNPDKYLIRLIDDENKNGIWDTGNYWEKTQPEKVFYYPEIIELRANWEIETIWEFD